MCTYRSYHHKRLRMSYCVFILGAGFDIPITADRVYWHSCLIACSIVHSVRANPSFHSLPPSWSLCVSLPLPHSSEHQSHYTHSHTENVNGLSRCRHASKHAQNKWLLCANSIWRIHWFNGSICETGCLFCQHTVCILSWCWQHLQQWWCQFLVLALQNTEWMLDNS